MILFFIPTIFFRLTLKSITILYLPIIWFAKIPVRKNDNFKTKLRKIYDTPFTQIELYISLFSLTWFIFWVFIFPFTDIKLWLDTVSSQKILNLLYEPEINLISITGACASFLTLMYFKFFHIIVLEREINPEYGNYWGVLLYDTKIIRDILSYFTMGTTIYFMYVKFLPDDYFTQLDIYLENIKITIN